MLYLVGQFAWFLLAAAALGLAMGWIGQSSRDIRFWSPAWTGLAVLWAVGAALAWFQFVNGVLATWIETALLFAATYWLGCAAGGLLGAAASPRPSPGAPAGAEPALEAPAPSAPPAEGENAHPGRRPAGLAAARQEKADDLKLIKGIGSQNEERLHGLGIWHFDQIAAWTPQNVEWVGSYLAFPGRIEREDWVGQAADRAEAGTASAEPGGGADKAGPSAGNGARDLSPVDKPANEKSAEAPDAKKP